MINKIYLFQKKIEKEGKLPESNETNKNDNINIPDSNLYLKKMRILIHHQNLGFMIINNQKTPLILKKKK